MLQNKFCRIDARKKIIVLIYCIVKRNTIYYNYVCKYKQQFFRGESVKTFLKITTKFLLTFLWEDNMANKTANLYARIEPETKLSAESILETLGIPVSTAINMFYKQIILNNGLPFDVKVPNKKNINLSEMTEEQFNLDMEQSYKNMLNNEGLSVDEAFSSIKKAK